MTSELEVTAIDGHVHKAISELLSCEKTVNVFKDETKVGQSVILFYPRPQSIIYD